MMKRKKTMASLSRKEEAQDKNSRYMFDNPTATHHNNEYRVDVNKNDENHDVPDLQRCLANLLKNHKMAVDNLQNENNCLQNKITEQEKRNIRLTSLLELKQKEITELYHLVGIQKNLNDNELQEVNTEMTKMTKSSKINQKQIKSLTKEQEKVQTPTPRHNEDIIISTHGPPAKKRKIGNSRKDHYTQSCLKELVRKLELRHSDKYELWRNVLWALNQYGCERGYDTLKIANDFSKRSSKYKNLQDVKKTFESSDGTLSLQYLVEVNKIKEEQLDGVTEFLNDILPSRYLPSTANQIDCRDSHKIRLNVNSADESHTLFIIPDLYVLTDGDGKRLSFLQKIRRTCNSNLATVWPEMKHGFEVTFKESLYEFKALFKASGTFKLCHPLEPAESFIILPSGKQINKASHLTKIREVLRADALKFLRRSWRLRLSGLHT